MRKALILVAALATLMALSVPASAADEVPVTVQSNNGRVVVPFGDDVDCFGEIAVDVQYGFLSDGDPQADIARVFVRVSRFDLVARVQIDRLRLRSDAQFTDDRRPGKEFLAPADPLNSAEVGNPFDLRAGSDWNDSDSTDDYPSDPSVGDDAIPTGIVPGTFTFTTTSNVSARVDIGIRCTNGAGFKQSVVTSVSNPPPN